MGPGAPEWPALGPAGPLPHLKDTETYLCPVLPPTTFTKHPQNTPRPKGLTFYPQLPSLSFLRAKEASEVQNLISRGFHTLFLPFPLSPAPDPASPLFD